MTDPTQSTTEVPPETQPTNGVQQRIDELTATIHEERRAREQANQTNQELIAQVAALAARNNQPQQPTTPPLPEGVDPGMAQFFMEQFKTMQAESNRILEQKLSMVTGTLRQSQEQMEFQQASSGRDPKVTQRAAQLLQNWKKMGATGFAPTDAIIYAQGQLAEEARIAGLRNRPNGDGNDYSTPGGGSTPNPAPQSRLPAPKSDEEIRKMTFNERINYYGSRVGDSEIQY